MSEVLPLSQIATIIALETLLNHPPDLSSGTLRAIKVLLRADHYSTVSDLVLDRLRTFYPHLVTDDILRLLLPPGLTKLSIPAEAKVTTAGLKEAVKSCGRLTSLSLTGGGEHSDNLFIELSLTSSRLAQTLTSLTLTKCDQVRDTTIKCVLRLLPRLQQLNLAGCVNITDNVFLVDKQKQLTRLTSKQAIPQDFVSQLMDVDVSECAQLTSFAICYLTSLCGPTLRSINISHTAVDCTGLLFLSGLSLQGSILCADRKLDADKPLLDVHQSLSNGLPHSTLVSLLPSGELQEVLKLPEGADDLRLEDVEEDDEEGLYNGLRPYCVRQANSESQTDADLTSLAASPEHCDKTERNSSKEGRRDDQLENSHRPETNCLAGENGQILPNTSCESCDTYSADPSELSCSASASATNCDKPEKPDECNSQIQDCEDLTTRVNRSMYTPALQSVIMTHTPQTQNAMLRETCVETLLRACPRLSTLHLSWEDTDDRLTGTLARHGGDLRRLVLGGVSESGLAAVASHCTNLRSLDLIDCSFITDSALLTILSNGPLTRLSLSATMITDKLLTKVSETCSDELRELDISYCEAVTDAGIDRVVSSCRQLRALTLSYCAPSTFSIFLTATHCTQLSTLHIPSVNCVTDECLIAIAIRLKNLQKLDISWNLEVTDIGISALMTNATKLEHLVSVGLKQITTAPFWLLVSDIAALRLCKATLLLERKLRALQPDVCSSDEEYDLDLPLRSTVHAPCLRRLALDWCDCACEAQLAEIALVCRGSIVITDYYEEIVKPGFVEES